MAMLQIPLYIDSGKSFLVCTLNSNFASIDLIIDTQTVQSYILQSKRVSAKHIKLLA